MANTNILEGIQCPKCKHEDSFKICAAIWCDVTDEGSEVEGDHEWDEESLIHCGSCGHGGTVNQFTADDERQKSLELNAILAGLRLLQRTKTLPAGILDVLTNGEEKAAVLDDAAIDELCEKLNCGGYIK